MDIRALECFVAVAEELHFRRAAARLNMTQPSAIWLRAGRCRLQAGSCRRSVRLEAAKVVGAEAERIEQSFEKALEGVAAACGLSVVTSKRFALIFAIAADARRLI